MTLTNFTINSILFDETNDPVPFLDVTDIATFQQLDQALFNQVLSDPDHPFNVALNSPATLITSTELRLGDFDNGVRTLGDFSNGNQTVTSIEGYIDGIQVFETSVAADNLTNTYRDVSISALGGTYSTNLTDVSSLVVPLENLLYYRDNDAADLVSFGLPLQLAGTEEFEIRDLSSNEAFVRIALEPSGTAVLQTGGATLVLDPSLGLTAAPIGPLMAIVNELALGTDADIATAIGHLDGIALEGARLVSDLGTELLSFEGSVTSTAIETDAIEVIGTDRDDVVDLLTLNGLGIASPIVEINGLGAGNDTVVLSQDFGAVRVAGVETIALGDATDGLSLAEATAGLSVSYGAGGLVLTSPSLATTLIIGADVGADLISFEAGTAQTNDLYDVLSGVDARLGFARDGGTSSLVEGTFGQDSILVGLGSANTLFADGYDLVTDAIVAAEVYRLYLATLGRAPDLPGITGWVDALTAGFDFNDTVAGFTQSPEFQATYGTLTDTQFVELLYQNVLNRTPGQSEVDAWLNFLASGASREDVVIGFSNSPEFITNTAGEIALYLDERRESVWVDDIYRLYQATLGRAPDKAGLEGWAGFLANDTIAFEGIVAGFTQSVEFQTTYGTLTETQFVELLYQNVLGRAPAAAEVQGWTDLIAGGLSREDVVIGFSQSVEFRDATAADVADWVRAQGTDDVLIASAGSSLMQGGALSDVFVFDAMTQPSAIVTDLESWDILEFVNLDAGTTEADVLATLEVDGADVIFTDFGLDLRFENTALADITAEMILV